MLHVGMQAMAIAHADLRQPFSLYGNFKIFVILFFPSYL